MSQTLKRSFVKIYPYGCETPLPILLPIPIRNCIVEVYFNCTDKRTFATFHVTDAATSCILGKYTSESLCVLTGLQPTKYDNTTVKYIFEGRSALKNFELNIQSNHSVQPFIQKPRRLPFLMKKQVENEVQKLLEQDFIETSDFFT